MFLHINCSTSSLKRINSDVDTWCCTDVVIVVASAAAFAADMLRVVIFFFFLSLSVTLALSYRSTTRKLLIIQFESRITLVG